MAAATIRGTAIVYGPGGTVTFAGLVTLSTFTSQVQSNSFERTGDMAGWRDEDGHECGFVFFNGGKGVRLTYIPSKKTGTIAEAVAQAVLPGKGDILTLADFTPTDLNDTYLIETATRDMDNNGNPASITITAFNRNDNDVATTPSAS